jgi:hypothetical protein
VRTTEGRPLFTHRAAPAPRGTSRRGVASASLLAVSALAIAAVPAVSGSDLEPGEPSGSSVTGDAGTDDGTVVHHTTVNAADAITIRAPRPSGPASGAWLGEEHRRVADERAASDLVRAAVTTALPTAATTDAVRQDEAELVYLGTDGERIDVPRIRDWLEGRGSPMAPYAADLVAAGVAYDVDPRVVLGIAGIESTVGEQIPEGSHNAWGWNGDGPRGLKAWGSWPEAIDDYTERLGRLYDTDNVDEDFARTYCPPNWEKWLTTVQWVIDDI